ncbi:MAG: hypothetical protein COV44_03750 [Deltaproteobacteria bacterium CG11_big_fil_rev_8_21_14_0_20_45_16]|nr:MAG: hypothetical protein COV44_03750 [Deltaproteobacteria bacterium CG11_big_fil_rev_8_21_14_0_20_45_16]
MHLIILTVREEEVLQENSFPGLDKRLGSIMIDKGFIDMKQLSAALMAQQELMVKNAKSLKLGEILLFSQQVSPIQLRAALSLQVHRSMQSRNESMRINRMARAKERSHSASRTKPQSFWASLKAKLNF